MYAATHPSGIREGIGVYSSPPARPGYHPSPSLSDVTYPCLLLGVDSRRTQRDKGPGCKEEDPAADGE